MGERLCADVRLAARALSELCEWTTADVCTLKQIQWLRRQGIVVVEEKERVPQRRRTLGGPSPARARLDAQ